MYAGANMGHPSRTMDSGEETKSQPMSLARAPEDAT
jgi:hypothetical protein